MAELARDLRESSYRSRVATVSAIDEGLVCFHLDEREEKRVLMRDIWRSDLLSDLRFLKAPTASRVSIWSKSCESSER